MSRYPCPIIHPSRGSLPVLLSVPHSGRDYDAALLANAAKGRASLEPLENPLVDRLAWRAIAAGLGAIIQPVPRAVIDCNRDEEELDPAAIAGVGAEPVGSRARHGLGLVPSRTHRHGALWRRPIDHAELNRRIEQVHRPYHDALADALQALKKRHGEVLLLDCHSMPSRRQTRPGVVIGDRHGTTSASWIREEVMRLIRGAGLPAMLNDPYAGGSIVARHGRPAERVHALQLEFDRTLYLDRGGRQAGPGFDGIASLLETVAVGLGQALLDNQLRDAAE